VTAADLLKALRKKLKLSSAIGDVGFDRLITSPDISRPGLCLTGYTHNFLHERIQIFGETEVTLLKMLDPDLRKEAISNVFSFPVNCSLVTKGLEPPPELVEASRDARAALFISSRDTTPLIHDLGDFLTEVFSPVESVHGTLVDVFGVGLLCTGKSSIGKSEAVLGLMERGHRLVADDMVRIRRISDKLVGSGDTLMSYHMEIRGLGMVNIADLFGIRSTKERQQVDLEVRLQAWSEVQEPDRTGLSGTEARILDVSIPLIILPVLPGRNLSLLLEVAVLNHILDKRGMNPARKLNRALIRRMTGEKPEKEG